jgi:hypothetical protein
MRKVTVDRNATLWYKLIGIHIAGYADNIRITGRRKEAMKQTYEQLKTAAIGRLIFNVNKTKIMITSRHDTHEEEMKTGADTIEVVYEFVYRGTCITKQR